MLKVFLNLVLAAKTRCINEYIFSSIVLHDSIHRIPGGSRNIRHDQAVLAEQCVDQRRLPDIRFSDNGDLGPVILHLARLCLRKILQHLVKQIADSRPVRRGNRMRIADSKIVKLVDARLIFDKIVNLVDNQQNTLMASAQHVSNLRVRIDQSLMEIRQEKDDIGRVNRNLGLLPHLGKDDILCIRLYSAGINQCKTSPGPLDICIDAVSGYTGCIFNNRDS